MKSFHLAKLLTFHTNIELVHKSSVVLDENLTGPGILMSIKIHRRTQKSSHPSNGATNPVGQEIQCLPYAGFLVEEKTLIYI